MLSARPVHWTFSLLGLQDDLSLMTLMTAAFLLDLLVVVVVIVVGLELEEFQVEVVMEGAAAVGTC
jgi:hypothetical protein